MPQLWIHRRLHQDLWGNWVLTQAWGSRDNRLGRVKHRACVDYAEGLQRLEEIGRQRARRGYVLD